MLTTNKTDSIVRSILGILLTVVLLTTACPITAYAADDNPVFCTLDVFPALGVSSDTMDVNNGMINTLYGGGTVKDNRGTISSSLGTVFENHGSIESLIAGHVGTNNGTINRIENTGSLSVNDKGGKVLFLGMGNVVDRNDGMIQVNAGSVSDNYGTVSDNYGTVIMHDGQIVNNYQNGTVTFEAKISGGKTIPAKGTIDNNESHVKIYSGTVTIKENTGDIEITNATVTVSENAGSITLGANATLICNENNDTGVITKTDESARINCGSNNGHINDETVVKYKIVFVGDDGKAEIIACDLEKDGVYYTQVGGGVIFTLPPGYECSAARKLKSGNVNTWGLNANPAEGDTEFTIICRKCSPCDSQGHSYGEWVTTKEATETETGTKERTCSVCGDKDTGVIPVLPHTHNGILQNGTSAACTVAGVKDCYTCSCGKTFEDATWNIEVADLDAWKAEGGNGYIAPKGHAYGEWKITMEPNLTEKGRKERVCSVCGAKETEEIPVLTPVSYKIVSSASSEWTKGSTSGLILTSDADFAKFVCVKVDGAEIAATNYTAVSGSTKVVLNAAYLETLSEGSHPFEIVSNDGSASTNFTVRTDFQPADSNNPQTGDSSMIYLWTLILVVSVAGLSATAIYSRKRKITK